MSKVKLLYICGYSRSGSTLLSNILDQIDGFFNAGELMYIWNRIKSPNGICGCGSHICNCHVWGGILNEAFGGPDHVDCEEMIRSRNRTWNSMKVPIWMWLPAARKRLICSVGNYLTNLGKLYASIGSTISARLIVDTSKNPAYLYMLSMISEIELYIIHIIRDPRATAYSWSRKKEGFWQISSWRSSLSWSVRNLIAELLGRRFGKRYMRLNYENLIAYPKKVVSAIVDMAEEQQKSLTFIKDKKVNLAQNHCVFGNPSLFQTGWVKLQIDERWKHMRRLDRIIATTLTWPLIIRYGYPVFQ